MTENYNTTNQPEQKDTTLTNLKLEFDKPLTKDQITEIEQIEKTLVNPTNNTKKQTPIKDKCNIRDAPELFCYKMTLKFEAEQGKPFYEELYVTAPNLADACTAAYEICTEIIKTEFCGNAAIGRTNK